MGAHLIRYGHPYYSIWWPISSRWRRGDSAKRPAKIGAPGRNRTGDLALRRHSLYPLSYRGRKWRPESHTRPLLMVEEKGIEPSTFALRTRRSPNLATPPKRTKNTTSKA